MQKQLIILGEAIKTLSHDEKMILIRIEVIFCGAYGDIDRQIIDIAASLQHKDNDLKGYLRCFYEKEGINMKYRSKSFYSILFRWGICSS